MKHRLASILLLASAALPSCKSAESKLSNNGQEIDAENFPASLLLQMKLSLDSGAIINEICTGGFISKRYFLTAAHCVVDPIAKAKFKDKEFKISAAKDSSVFVSSRTYIAHPDYPEQEKLKLDAINWLLTPPEQKPDIKSAYSDLAVIDVGTVEHSFPLIELAGESPKVGELLHIVGFGVLPASQKEGGIKRTGTNRLIRNDGLLQMTLNQNKQENTQVGGGDSGGGLYNEGGKIVGTVSIAVFSDNIFVDINHPKARQFIDKYLAHQEQKPSQEKPKTLVGGYSYEQQKAWGKCGESWMQGVCDFVCEK